MTVGPEMRQWFRLEEHSARKPREEAGYHRLSTHLCLHSKSAWDLECPMNEVLGSMMQICMPHVSSIPIAQGSPLPICHQETAPTPFLGISVRGQSLEELLWGLGSSAFLLRLPVTFLQEKGSILQKTTCQRYDRGH